MEMVCGRRALDYLSQIYAQNRLVCQTFSAKPMETGAAAQHRPGSGGGKAQAALETRCFAATASSLAGAGDVVLFEEDLPRRRAPVGRRCGQCLSGPVAASSPARTKRGTVMPSTPPIGGLQPLCTEL